MAEHFYNFARDLGFPRHLSQHVGGLYYHQESHQHLVPVENASMPDRTVIQWDKEDIEALGLLKNRYSGPGNADRHPSLL